MIDYCGYMKATARKIPKMSTHTVVRAGSIVIPKDELLKCSRPWDCRCPMPFACYCCEWRMRSDCHSPVQVPNATTLKAMKELHEGKGKRVGSAEELFRDLGHLTCYPRFDPRSSTATSEGLPSGGRSVLSGTSCVAQTFQGFSGRYDWNAFYFSKREHVFLIA